MVATHEEQVRRLDELIRDIDVAMLTTAAPDGSLRSRPLVSQRLPFDGTLWFFTRVPSGKTREIARDEHVSLSFADPGRGRFVSVSGVASTVRDRERGAALWRPELRTWFPAGLDDPDLALLRVDVTDAEYWDAPSGAMVRLAGLVRSAVTGRVSPGEHEKIQVS
jgi:general stress protein 26